MAGDTQNRLNIDMKNVTAGNVDEYIARYPSDVQALLEHVRATIKEVAPDAIETIKYAIPTFVLNGNLISFAAYKNHIGIYPAPAGGKAFEKQLAAYRKGKSTVQFPLDRPIPTSLLKQIVALRSGKNLRKSKSRGKY